MALPNHDDRPPRGGSRARLRAAATLTFAVLAAGLLVGATALLGLGGSGGGSSAFRFEGTLAFGQHRSLALVRRSLRADRARLVRCARPAYRAPTPSPRRA
jgi:hypothetical protein